MKPFNIPPHLVKATPSPASGLFSSVGPRLTMAKGDAPGHEFRGNQWRRLGAAAGKQKEAAEARHKQLEAKHGGSPTQESGELLDRSARSVQSYRNAQEAYNRAGAHADKGDHFTAGIIGEHARLHQSNAEDHDAAVRSMTERK